MRRAATRARRMTRDCLSRKTRAFASARAPPADVEPKLWPSVRALLNEHGLDARACMPGSGPNGHLTRADVMLAIGSVDLDHLERIGARRPRAIPDVKPTSLMEDYAFGLAETQTWTEEHIDRERRDAAGTSGTRGTSTPRAYASADVDASEMASLRERVFKETGIEVSARDCVMYAVGRALREAPELRGAGTRDGADVRARAATEDGGWIASAVTRADEKTLTEIAAEARAREKKAREGDSSGPDARADGSFSVVTLGALGVDAFAPVIDPPGVATVAIGAEKERVTLVDGRPTTTTTMTATVSADRRVADEADAARWLDAFAAQCRRASQWTV